MALRLPIKTILSKLHRSIDRLGQDQGPSASKDAAKVAVLLEVLRESAWQDREIVDAIQHLRSWRAQLATAKYRGHEELCLVLIELIDETIEPLRRRPSHMSRH